MLRYCAHRVSIVLAQLLCRFMKARFLCWLLQVVDCCIVLPRKIMVHPWDAPMVTLMCPFRVECVRDAGHVPSNISEE